MRTFGAVARVSGTVSRCLDEVSGEPHGSIRERGAALGLAIPVPCADAGEGMNE